jgi:hypothetical protein
MMHVAYIPMIAYCVRRRDLQARCLELEAQNAELKGAIAEVTARMEKYRKSYKEIGELFCVEELVLVLRTRVVDAGKSH